MSMTVQDQAIVRTPTVNAFRVDGGWIVAANRDHLDVDWQSVVVQLNLMDVEIHNDDFVATADGRLIWWVADG